MSPKQLSCDHNKNFETKLNFKNLKKLLRIFSTFWRLNRIHSETEIILAKTKFYFVYGQKKVHSIKMETSDMKLYKNRYLRYQNATTEAEAQLSVL
ncbi:hypothetical protein BpHYR1_034398 [Brachionus plicatilis]|uniref:Uncharacterized protein n=1 Tax=Brachionus plicatilis TaxID=10195 RepID=A0A3M7SVS1_BRAPC|nr:hypothetical protein BpHYR1_034398 [Brachionus plicatilis]